MRTAKASPFLLRRSSWLWLAVPSLLLAAVGYGAQWYFEELQGSEPRELRRLLASFRQLGVLGLLLTLCWLSIRLLAPERQSAVAAKAGGWIMGVLVFSTIFFLTGELAVRIAYPHGESFSGRGGVMRADFEKDFQLNRYDGPSRGPEIVETGVSEGLRILVIGDSITWGQGVRDERALFSQLLLDRIRADVPEAEMAVLAKPGRNMDGHLAQIRKWGSAVDPDVIVYQWYINDMELDKPGHSAAARPWRKFFLYPLLMQHSYFWVVLDYYVDLLGPSGGRTYVEYIEEDFAEDTEAWQAFRSTFQSWAAEAKALTSNVLIVLFPHPSGSSEIVFQDFHDRMTRLADDEGILVLDLAATFVEEQKGDFTAFRATRFDNHPNARAHAVAFNEIYETLRQRWPELFR